MSAKSPASPTNDPAPAAGEPYCGNCGYVLTGATESAKCPECGRPLVEVLRRRGQVVWRSVRYRSTTTLLGMPLLAVSLGPSETQRMGHARGFIAIGDAATGAVALGGRATGIVAIGGISVGVFAAGGLGIGGVALGGMAIGGLSVGGMAIGAFATGGGAVGYIAVGGGAAGIYAAGGGAYGPHTVSPRGTDPQAKIVFDNMAWLLGSRPASALPFAWAGGAIAAVLVLLVLMAWVRSGGGLFAELRQALTKRDSGGAQERIMPIIDISPRLSPRLAVFPGDTPLSREVLLDMKSGAAITLSTLRATVHLGAHVDGPNHYGVNARAIDEQPLDLYVGPCRVFRVAAPAGHRVRLADLDGPIDAERILIATGTYPDPERWTDDFAAVDPALVDELHAKGVRLVGIDTPSVDTADSKDLPSHQRFLANDMAILEGVVLTDVAPGRYELIALPLALEGFDASPVRAVLRGGGD